MGVFGRKQQTPLLPFPKSPHATAPGVLLTHAYLPTTLLPLSVGQRQGGGEGGRGGTPFGSCLSYSVVGCWAVFVPWSFQLRLGLLWAVFVPWSFQLRLGLLCLLLVLVLVGRRGGGQRGVCVACRRILLVDMRVAAFVFWLYRILWLDRSCGLAVVFIFV